MITRRGFTAAMLGSAVFGPRSLAAGPQPAVGLIFASLSECPYCLQIAPVLYRLQWEASVPVLVASFDNRAVFPFEQAHDARAHPLTAHYTRVPQVLVYNRALDGVTHEIGGQRSLRHFVQKLSLALRHSSDMTPR